LTIVFFGWALLNKSIDLAYLTVVWQHKKIMLCLQDFLREEGEEMSVSLVQA
jgi:hypothetical protein